MLVVVVVSMLMCSLVRVMMVVVIWLGISVLLSCWLFLVVMNIDVLSILVVGVVFIGLV